MQSSINHNKKIELSSDFWISSCEEGCRYEEGVELKLNGEVVFSKADEHPAQAAKRLLEQLGFTDVVIV